GVGVDAIVDARADVAEDLLDACATRGIPVHAASVVTGTRGETRVTHALVSGPAGSSVVECDVLLVSGGWNPAVHLFSQARGQLRYDEALGAFVPAEQLDGVSVAGAADGVFDLPGCLRGGREAAAAALSELGFAASPEPLAGENDPVRVRADGLVMWRVA